MFGWTKKQEIIANINDIENIISFLKKSNNLHATLSIVLF